MNAVSGAAAAIPVTLLTGFLGSGKTTLLNGLLGQPELADTLVIINEFGTIALDHLLVAHSEEELVVELGSGCICCTIRRDLADTLRDIEARLAGAHKRTFQRVIIETTGLADPVPIVHTLLADRALAARYRLQGIVVTVDAATALATLDAHAEAVRQAALADLLVVTKTDLAPSNDLAELALRLEALNPGAQQAIVTRGRLAARTVLDLGTFTADGKSGDELRWLNAAAYARVSGRTGIPRMLARGPGGRSPRHDDAISSFAFTHDAPLDPDLFDCWLDVLLALAGPAVLRMKGILNVAGEEGPIVVHVVQHLVHPPECLPAWPDEDRRTRLVFITQGLSRHVVEGTFKALAGLPDVAALAGPDASAGPAQGGAAAPQA